MSGGFGLVIAEVSSAGNEICKGGDADGINPYTDDRLESLL
jgi:hypothetical protein